MSSEEWKIIDEVSWNGIHIFCGNKSISLDLRKWKVDKNNVLGLINIYPRKGKETEELFQDIESGNVYNQKGERMGAG